MNRLTYIYRSLVTAAIITTFFAASSCKKFLDVVPSELVTSDQVWGNINNANGVLANLYSKMPGSLTDGWTNEICAATDECYHHWGAGFYPLYYNTGAWNAANNPYDIWADAYQKIRQCNLFLENIDKVPVPENQQSYYATILPRYKAEARVLRAFFYFDLLRRYGAVPILTRSYAASEAGEMQMPRMPVDSVVNFIAIECEQAAEILPVNYADGDLGRISKGGALALATRTLAYAASPLFNGNPLYKDIKNPDGTPLFSQMADKEKWKRAADEALKVLNLNMYTLNTVPGDPINSYSRVFNTRNWDEIIVAKQQNNSKNIENECLPYGGWFGGWGKYSILQEFVDAYEMNNGYPIYDPSSGYDSVGTWSGDIFGADGYSENVHFDDISKMYRNRDPRFYATVTFQGSKWAIRHTANTPVWMSWWGSNGGTSQGWPKSTGTYPVSGYNPRKWLSPDVDMLNYWTSPDAKRNDPVIRLPEIYLIYAEALNEYNQGPTVEAFNAINKVRARVNMPALPIIADDNTLAGFRARVQNENRVEFAFEAHRFWDVRRWMIGTTVDNGPVHGLNARPSTQELQASGFDVNSKEAGLSVFYKRVVIQTRVFQPKHYLFPIPQTEIEVNHQLVQNYGW